MTKPGHHYHLGGSLTSLALLSSSNTSNRVTYDISDLTVIIRVTTPPVYAGSEYLTVDSSQKYYTALIWPSFGISNPEIILQFAWLIRSCDLGLSWHSSQPSQPGRAVCDGQEDTGRCMGQVWSMIKLWLIVTGMENRSDERERVVNIKIISCRHRNRLSETLHVTDFQKFLPYFNVSEWENSGYPENFHSSAASLKLGSVHGEKEKERRRESKRKTCVCLDCIWRWQCEMRRWKIVRSEMLTEHLQKLSLKSPP